MGHEDAGPSVPSGERSKLYRLTMETQGKLRERDKEAVIGTKVTQNNEEWTQNSSFMPVANGTDGAGPGGFLPSCTGQNVGVGSRLKRMQDHFVVYNYLIAMLLSNVSHFSTWNVISSQRSSESAQKSSLECVDRKLSCLVVHQPTRSLIGVAMAEGICVDWVSNSSVLAEVARTASPLCLCAAAAAGFTELLRIGGCVLLLLTAVQFFHLRCSFINQH